MTDEMMNLRGLLEKSADADLHGRATHPQAEEGLPLWGPRTSYTTLRDMTRSACMPISEAALVASMASLASSHDAWPLPVSSLPTPRWPGSLGTGRSSAVHHLASREVIAAPTTTPSRPMRSETRATLLTAVAKGRLWLDEILSGTAASAEAIAEREGLNATTSLAFTAPDIMQAAIAGTLPHGIGLRQMVDPAPLWTRQRNQLGLG